MYADEEEARQRARARQNPRGGYRQGPAVSQVSVAPGFKRKREEEIADSPNPLLAALVTLGDRQRSRVCTFARVKAAAKMRKGPVIAIQTAGCRS